MAIAYAAACTPGFKGKLWGFLGIASRGFSLNAECCSVVVSAKEDFSFGVELALLSISILGVLCMVHFVLAQKTCRRRPSN